jgi:rhodanese-related sulfurtransferase
MEGKIIHLGSHEAYDLLKDGEAILLDIRSEAMQNFKQIDVPKFVLIPFTDLSEQAAALPYDRFFICADSTGIQSKAAAQILLSAGFKVAGNLAGGLVDWERAGLPVRINIKERLSGSCMCQLRKRESKK